VTFFGFILVKGLCCW